MSKIKQYHLIELFNIDLSMIDDSKIKWESDF